GVVKMQFSVKTGKYVYQFFRALTAAFGALIVGFDFVLFFQLRYPQIKPLWQELHIYIGLFVYGFLLLLPHRWTIRGIPFYLKLFLLGLGLLWVIRISISAIDDQHDIMWICFALLAFCGPVTLIMKYLLFRMKT
ncbi:hypothetical protein L0244_20850, partial [bacterium]|nr:hypothetical protein [bacterium]